MNEYLVVLHIYDPRGNEFLRVLHTESDGDERETVSSIVGRMHLQPEWSVRSADVYPYTKPTTFVVLAQADWIVGEVRES